MRKERSSAGVSCSAGGRSAASLASICMISSSSTGGISPASARGGRGRALACWWRRAASTSPENGGRPVTIS